MLLYTSGQHTQWVQYTCMKNEKVCDTKAKFLNQQEQIVKQTRAKLRKAS